MKKLMVLVMTCFWLALPTLAFCQVGWTGNVNLFLGKSILTTTIGSQLRNMGKQVFLLILDRRPGL